MGSTTDSMERGAREWWRDAVVYEIYVRSFADSDGDGLGDLAGIRSRLGALVELGVDAIWLTPFYRSPQADGGYDVEDHRDVDPRFGTLADLDGLVADAHELGLRLLVDLVPNHTSDRHPWFVAAVAAGRGNAARARYIFRDGRGDAGELPPNDWMSLFGGPAWHRVTEPDGSPGQWYLHLFAPEQPDLDWNHPEVRADFEGILRCWLDRGVDGFRIDVAHGLMKESGLPDIRGRFEPGGLAQEGNPHWDQDGVHDIYRSWRRVLDGYDGDRTFVAEAYVGSPQRLARYVRPDELHTAFNFNLLHSPFSAGAFRTAIDGNVTALAPTGAPPTWVLSTHDATRPVTRYGGGEHGLRRARAAALTMLALPGVVYLYQGEELGLPEVLALPDDVRADPTFLRTGGADPGRDGCRVPLPWTGDEPSYGFGPGAASWLPQPHEWAGLARDRQRNEPASTLSLYRTALSLRHELGLGAATFGWIESPDDVVAFRAGDIACVTNFAADRRPLPIGLDGDRAVVVSVAGAVGEDIGPEACAWIPLR